MNIKRCYFHVSCFLFVVLLSQAAPAFSQNVQKGEGIPARVAADYIHAVIDSGRTVYSEFIVDRLSGSGALQASETWEQDGMLPLPAQFLLKSSRLTNSRGVGMRYRLTSLWPISPDNGPRSENEKIGLQEVARNPEKPFTWVVHQQGVWVFQAVYPDKAITGSCISCHNSHPNSPRKDFQLGEVMGGITINIPLGRSFQKAPDQEILIPPEVVADYVHAILESDRAVYARHVVDRMQSRDDVSARENWREENALMLPAQFLLTTSELIKGQHRGFGFRLISLWPINERNGPANEFERIGLETVDLHPVRPYVDYVQVGRKRYFQTIYADLAVTEGCVTCHNAHPKSPKNNFKLDDVMGGIRVTLPLN